MSASGVTVLKKTVIATGYSHVPNDAALVLGPTGLAFDEATGILYVASTADNAVYAVPAAERRTAAVERGSVGVLRPPAARPARTAPRAEWELARGQRRQR